MIEFWMGEILIISCMLFGFIYMVTAYSQQEDHMGDFITYGTDKD